MSSSGSKGRAKNTETRLSVTTAAKTPLNNNRPSRARNPPRSPTPRRETGITTRSLSRQREKTRSRSRSPSVYTSPQAPNPEISSVNLEEEEMAHTAAPPPPNRPGSSGIPYSGLVEDLPPVQQQKGNLIKVGDRMVDFKRITADKIEDLKHFGLTLQEIKDYADFEEYVTKETCKSIGVPLNLPKLRADFKNICHKAGMSIAEMNLAIFQMATNGFKGGRDGIAQFQYNGLDGKPKNFPAGVIAALQGDHDKLAQRGGGGLLTFKRICDAFAMINAATIMDKEAEIEPVYHRRYGIPKHIAFIGSDIICSTQEGKAEWIREFGDAFMASYSSGKKGLLAPTLQRAKRRWAAMADKNERMTEKEFEQILEDHWVRAEGKIDAFYDRMEAALTLLEEARKK